MSRPFYVNPETPETSRAKRWAKRIIRSLTWLPKGFVRSIESNEKSRVRIRYVDREGQPRETEFRPDFIRIYYMPCILAAKSNWDDPDEIVDVCLNRLISIETTDDEHRYSLWLRDPRGKLVSPREY